MMVEVLAALRVALDNFPVPDKSKGLPSLGRHQLIQVLLDLQTELLVEEKGSSPSFSCLSTIAKPPYETSFDIL